MAHFAHFAVFWKLNDGPIVKLLYRLAVGTSGHFYQRKTSKRRAHTTGGMRTFGQLTFQAADFDDAAGKGDEK